MNTPIFDRFLFRDSSGLDLVFSGRVPDTYAGPAAPAAAIATAAGMLCGRVLERTEKGAMLSDVALYRTPAESIRLVIRTGGRPGPGPGPGTIACTSGRREIFSGRLSSEASSLQGRISGRISGERSACPWPRNRSWAGPRSAVASVSWVPAALAVALHFPSAWASPKSSTSHLQRPCFGCHLVARGPSPQSDTSLPSAAGAAHGCHLHGATSWFDGLSLVGVSGRDAHSTALSTTVSDITEKTTQLAGKNHRLDPAPIAATVRGVIKDVLDVDIDETADVHFGALGIDSISSLEMRRGLDEALQVELPATVIYDYPDVASLVEFVGGMLGDEDLVEMPVAYRDSSGGRPVGGGWGGVPSVSWASSGRAGRRADRRPAVTRT
jgi:acyl carrier protein